MKIITLLILSIIPATSLALSLVDPCIKEWPKSVPAGKIQMKYRISESCKPTNVNILVSEPSGAFDKFAMCQIKRVFPYWDPSEPIETITVEEYEKRLAQNRDEAPDKYHYRKIHAVNNSGEKVTLTCYFTKEWVVTGHAVGNGKTESPVKPEYIKSLPEQSFESTFESEF